MRLKTFTTVNESTTRVVREHHTWIQGGVMVGAFLLLYGSVFQQLVNIWVVRDDYSHGFLVLPISLYLVWANRDQLLQAQVTPGSPYGFLSVVVAGVLLAFGEAASIIALSGISLIVMIFGMVLFLLGKSFLKALSLPIAYLIFMVPALDVVVSPLHWPFQLLSARVVVEALQVLGIPVLLDGKYIVLPHVTLEVAKACSGVGYLVSLLAIALPLAHLALGTWRRKTALVVSALSIGVLANWVRVGIITVWAYWGGEVSHGPLHVLQGMFVMWVGLAGLFVLTWALAGGGRPATRLGAGRASEGRLSAVQFPYAEWTGAWRKGMLLVLAFFVYSLQAGPTPVEPKHPLAQFPTILGSWRGAEADLGQFQLRLKGADYELVRDYTNPEGDRLRVYIAYFTFQKHGKEVVTEQTRALHQHAQEVGIRIGPQHLRKVNRTLDLSARGPRRFVFWYDINGHVIADSYEAKLASGALSLLRGKNNAAFVLVSGELPSRTAFLEELLPTVRRFVL